MLEMDVRFMAFVSGRRRFLFYIFMLDKSLDFSWFYSYNYRW